MALAIIFIVPSVGFAQKKLSPECLEAIEKVKEQSQLPLKEMTESLKKDLGEFTDFNNRKGITLRATRQYRSYLYSLVIANITSSLTFGTHDLEQRQNEAKIAYTEQGWREFQIYLEKKGIINYIKNNQSYLTTSAINSPELIAAGILDDVLTWEISLDLISTYQSIKNKNSKRYKIIIYISWVKNENGDRSFKISGVCGYKTSKCSRWAKP